MVFVFSPLPQLLGMKQIMVWVILIFNFFVFLVFFQHIAASKGYEDIVVFLVEQGVGINISGWLFHYL